MSKPAFVLVPPPWNTAEIYTNVIVGLHSHGYDSVTVNLPSLGGKPPAFDFSEDVVAIKEAVLELANFGKDVVVVAHGFSGQWIGEIPESLSKTDRESRNRKGGVIRLVYISAFLVPEGWEVASRGDLSQIPPYIKTDAKVSVYIHCLTSPCRAHADTRSSDKQLIHSPVKCGNCSAGRCQTSVVPRSIR